MAETPAAAPGAHAPDAAAATAQGSARGNGSARFEPREALTIHELLDAGVHFGHQTRRWNPRMKPFLFGDRNGVHIIDLDQTLPRFQRALDFLRETVARGGKVLFVGTKRQAQAPMREQAERSEQYYVNRRWLGGMLTNFKTVKKSIERFKEMLELAGDAEKSAELSKKELSRVMRWIEKYRKSLDGIKEMTRLPDAMFVIDVNRESIAIKEAHRLGIPIVAVVDSNCDPQMIDHVIPGNDDSLRAIQLYCARVADACAEGALVHNERVQAEVAEKERARAGSEVPEKSGTGRVVVEIKQQPRRGRGAHSAGPREDRDRRDRHDKADKADKPDAPPAAGPAADVPTATE